MARCCIIGGAGFIGFHLIDALLHTGRTVRVVGRRDRALLNLPDKVEYCQGDIRNREFISQVLQDVDEVIDLAYSSVPKTSYENPIQDILGNLPPTVNLLEAASQLSIRKMVFVSSGGTVYGDPINLPINESHPTNPISPYGITKLAAEKYAFMFHKIKGLPAVCVRPSNPFGEYQKPFVGQGFIATAIASILLGREITIYGEHGTVRDYLYVKDVAQGILAALEYGIPGTCYNIGSGVGRNNKEVIDIILPLARSMGFAPKIVHLPPRPFDVAVNVLDSDKLKNTSDWAPAVSFDAAIMQTWRWFHQQYFSEAAK